MLGAAPLLLGARAVAHAGARQDDVTNVYQRAIVIDCLANPGSMNVSWPPRGPLASRSRKLSATWPVCNASAMY